MAQCYLCAQLFENIDSYIKHLKYHHKLHSTSNFHCSYCSQMFQSIYSFKRHLNKIHYAEFSNSYNTFLPNARIDHLYETSFNKIDNPNTLFNDEAYII